MKSLKLALAGVLALALAAPAFQVEAKTAKRVFTPVPRPVSDSPLSKDDILKKGGHCSFSNMCSLGSDLYDCSDPKACVKISE